MSALAEPVPPALPEPQLVTIPAGSFLMGSDRGQDNERPVHRVFLDAFRLAAHQVTNDDFACFLRATAQLPPPFWRDPNFSHPRQPVVGVSWHEAVSYCRWLAASTGRPYRLPTEAEWGRAARIPPQLCRPLAHRARTRRPIPAQRLRTFRYLRQRPRVVQRLVCPGLLRPLSRRQPARPRNRHPPGFPRGLLAPPHQDLPLRRPLQHPTPLPIRRLRVPHGLRLHTLSITSVPALATAADCLVTFVVPARERAQEEPALPNDHPHPCWRLTTGTATISACPWSTSATSPRFTLSANPPSEARRAPKSAPSTMSPSPSTPAKSSAWLANRGPARALSAASFSASSIPLPAVSISMVTTCLPPAAPNCAACAATCRSSFRIPSLHSIHASAWKTSSPSPSSFTNPSPPVPAASASPNFSAPSAWTSPPPAASPTNSAAASASALASPAPSRSVPNSSSPMNPSPPSTSASAPRSSTFSSNCSATSASPTSSFHIPCPSCAISPPASPSCNAVASWKPEPPSKSPAPRNTPTPSPCSMPPPKSRSEDPSRTILSTVFPTPPHGAAIPLPRPSHFLLA